MKSNFLFVFALLLSVFSFGQIAFQKTYGTASDEQTQKLIQTKDRGYCIVGSKDGFLSLLKTDSSGNLLWSQKYSIHCKAASLTDHFASLSQTRDKGYIICNTYDSTVKGQNGYLLKTDSLGNISWFKSYDSTSSFNSAISTLDHGYILAGQKYAKGGMILQKTDSSGNLLWATTVGSIYNEAGYDVIQSSLDSGYYMVGYGVSTTATLLSRFSKTGVNLWTKEIGLNSAGGVGQDAYHLAWESSGKIIISGNWGSYLCMIELDTSGTINRANEFSIAGSKSSFSQCSDKGYLISSSGKVYIHNQIEYYIILVRTDSLCNIKWEKRIDGPLDSFSNSILEDRDGGIVLGGSTKNFGSGKSDYYLIKTNAPGSNTCNDTTFSSSVAVLSGYTQAFGGAVGIVNSYPISHISVSTNALLLSNNACGCVPPKAGFTYLNNNFTDMSTWASKWHWDFGDGKIDTVSVNPSHGYTASGKYHICLTVSNACGSNTFCDSIIANPFPFSVKNTDPGGVSCNIYPNPTNGGVVIEFTNQVPSRNCQIEIANVLGEIVYQSEITLPKAFVELSSLAKGIYFLKIKMQNGGVISRKIAKE